MKTCVISWRASCDEFLDVDVFLPDPDQPGAEWAFMVSKEKATGLVTIGGIRWAKDKFADFIDPEEDPPLPVMIALAERMPEAKALLDEWAPNLKEV